MLYPLQNIYEGPVLKALTPRRTSGTLENIKWERFRVSGDGHEEPFCAPRSCHTSLGQNYKTGNFWVCDSSKLFLQPFLNHLGISNALSSIQIRLSILTLITFRALHMMCALCRKPLPCSPQSCPFLWPKVTSSNRPFPAHLEWVPICPLTPH